MILRVLAPIGVSLLVLAIAWIGGVDFNHRGFAQGLWLFWAFLAGVYAYTFSKG